MPKRLLKIARDNPELAKREDIKSTTEDIDVYAALAGFASSEAGGIVFASISKEIAATVSEIATGYKDLTETQLRALAARLEARITFLQSLSRARTNLDDAEDYLAQLIA
jgi:hypothetical protein